MPKGINRRDFEHFSGCLLGGAIGDALGAPAEFFSLSDIRRTFGKNGIEDFEEARGLDGKLYGKKGEFTDDTQMTLFTAEGLLRANCRYNHKGICNPITVVYHAYLRWLHTIGQTSNDESFEEKDDGWLITLKELHHRRAPGKTCISALQSGRWGTADTPINNSKGCGGIMRVAPVGLFVSQERAFEMGRDIAAITHGHPTGYLAAGFLALLLSQLIHGDSLQNSIRGAKQLLKSVPHSSECLEAIESALYHFSNSEPSPETVEKLGQGWIAEEALAISLYCSMAAGQSFAKGVLLAVNHSGDSDSTGAITGNILGALLGRKAIPEHWIERIQMRAIIDELSQDLLSGFRDDDSWWSKYPGW